MLVIGSVYDFATEAGDPGNIKKLEYTIVPATIRGGKIPLSEDGSFSFSFHTSGFSVPMVILVHTITASRRLEDPMLEHDTWYYYRVKPIEQENIASEIATAVPGRFAIVRAGGRLRHKRRCVRRGDRGKLRIYCGRPRGAAGNQAQHPAVIPPSRAHPIAGASNGFGLQGFRYALLVLFACGLAALIFSFFIKETIKTQ
jgi:hypothetical protein